MTSITRKAYTDMFGPTTGDKVRLGDTDLFIEKRAVTKTQYAAITPDYVYRHSQQCKTQVLTEQRNRISIDIQRRSWWHQQITDCRK